MQRLRILSALCLGLFLTGMAVAEGPAAPAEDVAGEVSIQEIPGFSALVPAMEQVASGAKGRPTRAVCTARCGNGTTVSCSGSSCSAQDHSCPTFDGMVSCDNGQYTVYCLPACPQSQCPVNHCGYQWDADRNCCVPQDPGCPYVDICNY